MQSYIRKQLELEQDAELHKEPPASGAIFRATSDTTLSELNADLHQEHLEPKLDAELHQ